MNELAAAKGTNKNSSHLAIGVDDPNTNYKSEYDESKTIFNKRYSHNKLKEVDSMPIGSNYNPDNDLIELRTFEHKNNKTYILLQKNTTDQRGIYITDPIMITYPYNEK